MCVCVFCLFLFSEGEKEEKENAKNAPPSSCAGVTESKKEGSDNEKTAAVGEEGKSKTRGAGGELQDGVGGVSKLAESPWFRQAKLSLHGCDRMTRSGALVFVCCSPQCGGRGEGNVSTGVQ